ncbi:hypothetical protein Poli38472_010585 [Pythium oligandrum]|uniref:Uncharacterized protein n=1 Tax=Pythium oligandrum TaxID=41045 RepID=A0A8K1C3J1_PYTOL|nr:hypothetical protein Poli38472_010585 [Pythium oligandrum]|eukprot:TMW55703.1 hypothetical protein Poli38472_010585 [Pythium oligandrum]
MWQRLAIVGLLAVSSLASATFVSEVDGAYNVTSDDLRRRLQRGELPGADKTQAAAANFDLFVLSVYYWPGHCVNSKGLAKCTTMPPQWKQGLIGPDGGAIKCNGKPYDKTTTPQGADQLVFPGVGVSNKSPDFYEYQYKKHGICSQMDQKKYWTAAVALGKQASAKLPTIPASGKTTAAELQKLFGPDAQMTCFRDAKKQTILWFVNFCYKRAEGIGGQTKCPGVSNCSGVITLRV